MMRRASLLCVAVGCALFAGCVSEDGTLGAMRSVDTSAMVTLGDAVAIAQAEVPKGFAVEVELELEDDDGEQEPPAWEIVFYDVAADQLVEVEVHAVSGEVLEVEIEDDGEEDDD